MKLLSPLLKLSDSPTVLRTSPAQSKHDPGRTCRRGVQRALGLSPLQPPLLERTALPPESGLNVCDFFLEELRSYQADSSPSFSSRFQTLLSVGSLSGSPRGDGFPTPRLSPCPIHSCGALTLAGRYVFGGFLRTLSPHNEKQFYSLVIPGNWHSCWHTIQQVYKSITSKGNRKRSKNSFLKGQTEAPFLKLWWAQETLGTMCSYADRSQMSCPFSFPPELLCR